MKTLVGTLLQPVSQTQCHVIKDSAVQIGDDGCISQIVTAKASSDAAGDSQCWIIPGFVDAQIEERRVGKEG